MPPNWPVHNKAFENDRLIARFLQKFVVIRHFLLFPMFIVMRRRHLNFALHGIKRQVTFII